MSKKNGVLDLVLKAEWFEKIKSGKKTTEFREVKQYWGEKIYEKKPGEKTKRVVDKVLFSKGYARKEQMLFEIKEIEILPTGIGTDLGIALPVYAIHLGEQLNIVEWYKQQKGGKNAR